MAGTAQRVATTALAVALSTLAGACGGRPAGGPAPPVSSAGSLGTVPVRAPASTLPSGPPYGIQKVTLALVDRSRPTVSHGRVLRPFRRLTTPVWLPAGPGRWPLIVFAHGFDVGPDTYGALLAAWAAHGYVVAAPEFPLTDRAVAGADLDENDINNQPADLRFVTDALTAARSPVSTRVEPGRVAVAGHSDGGESALAAGVRPAPAGEPRYRALIAMSVQPLPGSGAMANPPILVTQGDGDAINPFDDGMTAWQRAGSPKYLLVLHGGGHLAPLQPGSAWLPGVEAVTEAFLDAYLAGDAGRSGVTAAAAAASGGGLLSLRAG